MVSSVSSIIEIIKNGQNLSSTSTREETTTDLIAETILTSLASASPLEKYTAVQTIDLELQKKLSEALKKSLCTYSKTSNWKEAILGIHLDEKIDLHEVFLKYSNTSAHPIEMDQRSYFFSNRAFCASVGSTFATNKPHRLDHQGHPLLDAASACSCWKKSGHFNGFALALGDGAGGHFGDSHQDKRIARAAHFATKTCVRLLSAYDDPDALKQDLIPLLKHVEQEIRQKAMGENTTLVACRGFPSAQGFRIVGLNIGDSLLMAWHPSTKTSYPLLNSHLTEAGTALLLEAYRPFELQTVDTILPEGSLLILMSDGIHDTLPHQEQEGIYPNGLTYRIRMLTNLEVLLGSLPPDAPPEIYLRKFVQKAIKGAETLRQQQITADVQIGDDFSILLCQLTKPKSKGCLIN